MNLLLITIGLILVLLYALPLVTTKLNIGNIFGIFVGFFAIIIGAFFGTIIKFPKFLLLIFTALIIILSLAFIITLVAIIIHSVSNAKQENTIIVLGCRVKWDKPSLALLERCNCAYQHLKENPKSVAILSGGKGMDEKISEAQCMFEILCEKGISPSRLYIENKSTSTDENIRFTKEIIEKNNLSTNVVVATSDYHLLRAKIICKRCGLNAKSLSAKTLNFVKLPFFTREVFGIWALILKIKK